MQEMVIYGVSFDMVGKQPIVLLKTRRLQQVPADLDRPPRGRGDPHEAAGRVDAAPDDARPALRHARRARRQVHAASRSPSCATTPSSRRSRSRSNGREIEIDSRPSDALALAVRSGAPIFAAEEVIAESAIEFEHEVEDTEEVVEKFKEFLDQVTPGGLRRASELRSSTARATRSSAPTSSSKSIPAASAACGSRLVSVSPGIALTSSTDSSPSRVEHQVDAREAAAAEQPVARRARAPARARSPRRRARPGRRTRCARSRSAPRSRRSPRRAAPPRRSAAPRPSRIETARSRPSTCRSSSTCRE